MEYFACNDLKGKTIGGWLVGDRIVNNDVTTKYALYHEVSQDGINAIMKVLNYDKCLNANYLDGAKDQNDLLAREAEAFHFETELSKECAGSHMGNVIRYLDSGELKLDGYVVKNVAYIVYEMSEGKIGDFLKFSSKANLVADLGVLVDKLKSLHQVTKGVKQLHTHLIAHHNITPQSIEVFETNSLFKIGGLQKSRTRQAVLNSPVAAKLFDGDYTFAPPEAFFSHKISEEMSTYYQIDTYMLGNLVVYYLSSMNLTTLINQKCPCTLIDWASKGAGYQQVLPDIRKAFYESLDEIKASICVKELCDPIVEIIEGLCNPAPEERGYPGGFAKVQANADLQRLLTKLDVLYRKAQLLLYQNNDNKK